MLRRLTLRQQRLATSFVAALLALLAGRETRAQDISGSEFWPTIRGAAATNTFTIKAVFDSSITNDPNAASIENAINAVIAGYERKFSDPIAVTIVFFEMPSGLGASSSAFQV